jgi:hypothetical protein
MRALMEDAAFIVDRPNVAEIDQYVLEDGWTVGPHGALLLAAWNGNGWARISAQPLLRPHWPQARTTRGCLVLPARPYLGLIRRA